VQGKHRIKYRAGKKIKPRLLIMILFEYKITTTIITAMVVDMICASKNLSMFMDPKLRAKI
jgi:hypothetical protein